MAREKVTCVVGLLESNACFVFGMINKAEYFIHHSPRRQLTLLLSWNMGGTSASLHTIQDQWSCIVHNDVRELQLVRQRGEESVFERGGSLKRRTHVSNSSKQNKHLTLEVQSGSDYKGYFFSSLEFIF